MAAQVQGVAPGVSSTRLGLQACTVALQQGWQPRDTKVQFAWNEDEVKFTGFVRRERRWWIEAYHDVEVKLCGARVR